MKHLTHPETPEVVVEADEGREQILRSAGWVDAKLSASPKNSDQS